MDIGADKLRREIQIILKDADLNTLSSKKVRQMLEALFKCDFTERKKEIDDILMSEITTRDTTQTNHSEQDEQVDTSDDEKPSPSNVKKNKKQKKNNNNNNQIHQQQTTKSDEELAMEIHQQENRPSLRHSRSIVSRFSLFLSLDLRLFVLSLTFRNLLVLFQIKNPRRSNPNDVRPRITKN